MTKTEIAKSMAQVALLFPNFQLDAPTIRAWHKVFGCYELEEFDAALNQAALERGRDFFPSVGVVFDLIRPEKISSAQAWQLAIRFASNVQSFKNRDDVPRDLRTVIEQIGIERIGFASQTQLEFVRRDFCAAWDSSQESKQRLESSAVVALGRHDSKTALDSLERKLGLKVDLKQIDAKAGSAND